MAGPTPAETLGGIKLLAVIVSCAYAFWYVRWGKK